MNVDKSDEADARRFRWLLNGNSYFLEEERLCGHRDTVSEEDKDKARLAIDNEMKDVETIKRVISDHARSLIEFWQPTTRKK